MSGMRNKPAVLAGPLVLVMAVVAMGGQVKKGHELWRTGAEPISSHDFSVTPIPAGFFCPGSNPFTGIVYLKGAPLGMCDGQNVGLTDTVIERMQDTAVVVPPGTAPPINVEMRCLNLESRLPIAVTGGACAGNWDVRVTLDPSPASTGTMSIGFDTDTRGTYSTTLNVFPNFTFTKVGGGGGPLLLDPNVSVAVSATGQRWRSGALVDDQIIGGYTGDSSNPMGTGANGFYPTITQHSGPHPNVAGTGIPTVSEWGVAAMSLLVLVAGTVALRRSSGCAM